jgi:hypothetical protein
MSILQEQHKEVKRQLAHGLYRGTQRQLTLNMLNVYLNERIQEKEVA